MKHVKKLQLTLLAASVGLTASLAAGQAAAETTFILNQGGEPCGTVTGFSFGEGALTLVGLTGCDIEPTPPPTRDCGAGTIEDPDDSTQCIAAPNICGEGTTLSDGQCIAENTGGMTCGEGTEPNAEGTQCVPVVPVTPECGEGESLVDDQCVPDTPQPPVCEAGEELQGGVCVPVEPTTPGDQPPGGVNKSWNVSGFGPYTTKEEYVGRNGGTYHYYRINIPAGVVNTTFNPHVVPYSGANGASFTVWISQTIGGPAINRCDSVKSISGASIRAYVDHSGARASHCQLNAGKTYYVNVSDGVGGRFSWDPDEATCARAAGCQYRISADVQ